MTTKKSPDPTQQYSLVHVAPLGKLTAYTVFEHELDVIAAGEPATLAYNFAIALVSIGMSFLVTLTTTTIPSDRLFYAYLLACLNCLLAGVILFTFWLKARTSVAVTVAKIKSRLIVPTPVQEPPPGDPVGS